MQPQTTPETYIALGISTREVTRKFDQINSGNARAVHNSQGQSAQLYKNHSTTFAQYTEEESRMYQRVRQAQARGLSKEEWEQEEQKRAELLARRLAAVKPEQPKTKEKYQPTSTELDALVASINDDEDEPSERKKSQSSAKVKSKKDAPKESTTKEKESNYSPRFSARPQPAGEAKTEKKPVATPKP